MLAIFLCGCTLSRGNGSFPPMADTTATPKLSVQDDGKDRKILVANGLGKP